VCRPATATAVRTRSARLAERLERGARALADFARALTDAEWRMTWATVHEMNAAHAVRHSYHQLARLRAATHDSY